MLLANISLMVMKFRQLEKMPFRPWGSIYLREIFGCESGPMLKVNEE